MCRYITFRLIWFIFIGLAAWRFANGDPSTWGVLFTLFSVAFWALANDLAPFPRNNNNNAANGEKNQQVEREKETQTNSQRAIARKEK